MFSKIRNFIKKHLVYKKIIPIKTPVLQGELLSGKTAMIIGGSGGIGSAIAKSFVEQKCKVIITGTNEEKLKAVCEQAGESCKYILLNLLEVSTFAEKIGEAAKIFGDIDIFVNSAGYHGYDAFGKVTPETWDKVMNINLKGMYFMCQEVSAYMMDKGIKGKILNVSSASCNKPGWTPYEISKRGVKALTLGFADKLIKHGIVVNSIAPGPVATAMLNNNSNDDSLTWKANPSGRMATPEEVANLAVFMVSDMGELIVGDTYFISGGSGTVCLDK